MFLEVPKGFIHAQDLATILLWIATTTRAKIEASVAYATPVLAFCLLTHQIRIGVEATS
jgi:hypothetical protein